MNAIKQQAILLEVNREGFHQQIKQHAIWDNPLLKAIAAGNLKPKDYQYFFGQYYYFIQQYPRILMATICHCKENDKREQWLKLLAHETTEQESHANIFKQFLVQGLDLKRPENTHIEPFTKQFVDKFYTLCRRSNAATSAAIITYASKAIENRLYKIFHKELEHVALGDDNLEFYDIHSKPDQYHELTEDIALSYHHDHNWYPQCQRAIDFALDLRNNFFQAIYENIASRRFLPLVNDMIDHKLCRKYQHFDWYGKDSKLAHGKTEVLEAGLIQLVPTETKTIVSQGNETALLIANGKGLAIVGNHDIELTQHNATFIPRWTNCSIKNTGSEALVVFVVTDSKLIKFLP